MRVLIVEDTEAARYLQATWLRRAGFEVEEGATGAEGLARVSADVDVVVLDVHLPDMSGFDVCAAIKSDPATAGVPVMHVSATSVDVGSRTRGLDVGADAYLVEPVDRTEYLATVRSLARTRAARRSSERLTERLERLAAAALPVNSADSIARLLEAAVAGAADVFESPALAVTETDAGHAVRALTAGPGTAPISTTFAEPLTVEWRGTPLYLEETQLPLPWGPMLARLQIPRSRWFVWPLPSAEGASPAGLAVALPPEDQLSPEEEHILGQLVDTVAVALGNLRAYSREHGTALTLQRALLPDRQPVVPGLAFAAHYHASDDAVSIGGDFYDAFVLPSGAVAVVIGDVQGHSLAAAVVMAQLRFALRAFLVEHGRPGPAVTLLNTLLLTYHPDITATVALVVIAPATSTLEIVNAGHLPPLLLHDGRGDYLDEGGVLLGIPGAVHSSRSVPFLPGGTLVLVTDGLVERRGQDLDDGLAAMRDLLVAAYAPGSAPAGAPRGVPGGAPDGAPDGGGAAGPDGPEALAALLVNHFDVRRAEDDVAVLVVRNTRGERPAP